MLNLNRNNFKAYPFQLVFPSPWPLYTSISLLSLTTSGVLSFHGFAYAEYNLMIIIVTVNHYFEWIGSIYLEALDVSWKTFSDPLINFSPLTLLMQKKNTLARDLSGAYKDRSDIIGELKRSKDTLRLADMIDDSKNHALVMMKRDYPHFFDEDSGNTTKEGLKQMIDYYREEVSSVNLQLAKLKREMVSLDKEISKLQGAGVQLGEASNTTSILCILTRPSFFYIRFLAKHAFFYLSFFVSMSFLLISVSLPIINIPDVVISLTSYILDILKYEMLTYIIILIWYFYSYTKKIYKIIKFSSKIMYFLRTTAYLDFWFLLLLLVIIILT